MGDDPTKPKPKKKVNSGFDFSSAFDQSVNGNGNTNVQPSKQQSKSSSGFDFSQAFDQSLKKKVGGSEPTNTSQQPILQSGSQLPANNESQPSSRETGTSLFDNPQLNPFSHNGTSLTVNGAELPIVNPTPLGNSEEVIGGLADRVARKTTTPADIQNLANATGKPVSAVQAYVDNNKPLANAIEYTDKKAQNTTKLVSGIDNLNKTFGLGFDPATILNSADKSAEFLNGIDQIKKDEIQRRADNQRAQEISSRTGGGGLVQPQNIAPLDPNYLKQVDDFTTDLKNHVVNKTVEEDLQNGIPKEQTISKIFERIDPQGFQQNLKASTPYVPLGNIGQDLGKAYDYISGNDKEKTDLLNSQKGVAEQYYNNSLENLGLEKKSQGIINNDPQLTQQGDNILNQVDYNVTDKYPSLIKQEMVRRVNDAIARESGVAEGFDTEAGHRMERATGATFEDYARHLKDMGYLDDPKTRDLAMSLLSHPSYFADNSILGGVGNSFLQPFKDLGLSVGDITGFRNNKDILSDKLKGELFPADLESTPNADLKLKSDVRISRTIANTTANLSGMLAIATVTEGLGEGVGLSATASKGLGAYTSFGLPSFDASLKDSKNFIDNEPAQYLYATINAVANAEGGRLLDLGKITRIPGVSDEFATLAKGISNNTIDKAAATELLDKKIIPNYINFAVKYGKNVTKGAATMTAFNIKDNILKASFGDPNAAENILPQAGHAFLDGVLGMSILGGFGAATDMRNEKNTTYKGTIYNMALNPDAAKDVLTIGLKKGEYSKPEYDSKVQILNTAIVAKNTIDATEQELNTNLTQDQKAVYVANKTAEAVLRKRSEQEGLPEETKNKYIAQADRLAEQNGQVTDGLKFTPTLEPLYDLFDAEKNYNVAQENLKPGDKKSEDELLNAKGIYDKLYSDYLENNSSPSIIQNEKSSNEKSGSQSSNESSSQSSNQESGKENGVLTPPEKPAGAVDETAPISESDLLSKAKDLVNSDVVKGFTAEHLKEIANTNPEKLKEYLSNIADQAHDEHSVRATVDTYGKDLVGIATTLFPKETKSGADVSGSVVGENKINTTDYRGQHQLTEIKTNASDLQNGGTGFEWEHVAQDHDLSDKSTKESYRVLKSIKDNPDADVTIYRSVPKGIDKINEGDWITLSENYATEHGMDATDEGKDAPVISMKVKAKDIHWDGNDLNEFVYNPKIEKPNSIVDNPALKEKNNDAVDKGSIENKPTEKTSEQVADERAKELLAKRGVNVEPPTKNTDTQKEDVSLEQNKSGADIPPKETTPIAEGEGENKVGVSHRALTDLSQKLGLREPESGEYFSPQVYAERGRKLLKEGADPNEVNNPNNDLHDRISIARAHLEDLVKEADKIAKEKGIGSDEYKKALGEVEKYGNDVVKKLGTLAHRAFISLQGDRDIDTDSFTEVKRSFEDLNGKKPSAVQEKKIKELTETNLQLKKQTEDLEKKLIEETNKNIGNEKAKKSFTDKAKNIADKFRQLKSKPLSFKDENGNEIPIKIQGITWNDLVELGAKAIEKTGEIADGVAEIINKVKDTDWYKKLSENDKTAFAQKINDHYENSIQETPEAKKIKSLEKQKEDLLKGKITQKTGTPDYKFTEEEKAKVSKLEDDINQLKKDLGLIKGKVEKPLTDKEKSNAFDNDVKEIQSKFVDKKGNKFTPEEAKDIWNFAKKNYIDKGVSYRDMVSQVSNDTGLSWMQVSDALTTPKVKRISDEMWKKQAEYRRNQIATKRWVDEQNKSAAGKILKKVSGVFRGVSVFGHGGIFMGTHAGMTLFQPTTWSKTIPAFFRGWKYAYGNVGEFERAMEAFKNRSNYVLAQRAGLKNNPERLSGEEYQKSQKYLGKLGLAGERGFNAVKVLRQDLFDYHYNKLTEAEKQDPESAKSIAQLVNLATGATNLNIPEWINELTFAGGMEAARWGKLTKSPVKATTTALKAIFAPEKATTQERVFAKVWARRVGEQLATFSSLLAANAAIQALLNPNNPTNVSDPNKPDFLKFKFGDITLDPTSGMRGVGMFMYGLGKIPFEEQKQLHGDTRVLAAGKQTFGYGRGKLSPLYSTMADFYGGQDYSRNPLPFSNDKVAPGRHKLTWGEYAWEKAPLPVAEAANVTYQSAVNDGANKVTLNNILQGILSGAISGTTGFRVGEYNAEEANHSPFTEKDNKNPTFKYFLDKGLELPNTALYSEKVNYIDDKGNNVSKKISEYPKDVQEKYQTQHKADLKDELDFIKGQKYVFVKSINHDDGTEEKRVSINFPSSGNYETVDIDKLSKEELSQILHIAQIQATKKAKEEVFSNQ